MDAQQPASLPLPLLLAARMHAGHSKGGNNVLLYASQYDGDVEFIINIAGVVWARCSCGTMQLDRCRGPGWNGVATVCVVCVERVGCGGYRWKCSGQASQDTRSTCVWLWLLSAAHMVHHIM